MAEFTAARNNALPYPVYGLPYVVTFPLFDADGDPTSPSSPDSEISKNGDSFTDCTNEATEIATASGVCYLSLTGTELTTDIATVRIQSTGAKTTVLTMYPRKLVSIRTGTSASGGVSTSTIVLDGSASAVDDFYNGMIVAAVIDSATEVRTITDYTGSNQTCTVTPDWNTAPDNNDTFTIYRPDGVQIQQANTTHISSTAQTARDIGASVLISSGTGAGQLSINSGVVDAKLADGVAHGGTLGSSTATLALSRINVTSQTTDTAAVTINGNGVGAGIYMDSLAMTGEVAIAGAFSIDGTLSVGGDIGVTGNVAVTGTTTLTGAITATNAANDFRINGAAAGASGGLVINGSNSGTTTLAALTITGALTAGTNVVPWNAAWDAEVQSEVQDAIEVNNLDHLLKIAVDTDFATTVHLNSVLGNMADNGTAATFDRTTDSLEAIRDRGDSTWSGGLDAAGTRSALGMSSANLDTQLAAILSAASASNGNGANAVTITVNDGSSAIESAVVRLTQGVSTWSVSTNASGQAAFSMAAGTYTVSISKYSYSFTPVSLVVSTNPQTQTYSMTAVTPGSPSAAQYCLVYGYLRKPNGDALARVPVHFKLNSTDNTTTSGHIVQTTQFTKATDATGYLELELFKTDQFTNATWYVTCSPLGWSNKSLTLTTSSYDLKNL